MTTTRLLARDVEAHALSTLVTTPDPPPVVVGVENAPVAEHHIELSKWARFKRMARRHMAYLIDPRLLVFENAPEASRNPGA